MPSEADEVERYIEDAPEQRRPALRTLRAACSNALGDFQESIEYGMPSYSRAGEIEVAFASQKQYISVYVLRTDVIAAHRPQLDHLSVGKGTIRYPNDLLNDGSPSPTTSSLPLGTTARSEPAAPGALPEGPSSALRLLTHVLGPSRLS